MEYTDVFGWLTGRLYGDAGVLSKEKMSNAVVRCADGVLDRDCPGSLKFGSERERPYSKSEGVWGSEVAIGVS